MDDEPYSFILISLPTLQLTIGFTVLLILLICSALISGSEVAFFSLSPKQHIELKEKNSKRSKIALELLNKHKELLATILVLNNFVNVSIVILSSFLFISIYPLPESGIDYLRSFIEIAGITFIILLIGEVIPKIYANRKSLKIVLLMARPLNFLGKLPPFSWLQNSLVNGTDFILKYAKKKSVNLSTNDLEHAIALTREDTDKDEDQKILEGIVNFGNTDVRQIMCSRVDTVAVENSLTYNELLDVILNSGYSRIPVYKDSFDDVIGIIYVKDLLPYLNQNSEFQWQKLIRPPFFVPENKKIDDLLKEFQTKKIHLAVVVDEYGGGSGVVTLEDVLEEIVGEITDEFDEENVIYSKIDDRTFIFEGKTPLIDLYKVLDIDGKAFEQAKGESDSIAGFLIEQAGKILKNNETFEFENIKFIVEASDKKRVKLVKVINLKDNE